MSNGISSLNKSPGQNWTYYALLKSSRKTVSGLLKRIDRTSLSFGPICWTWKESRLIFQPKTDRETYTSAKDFRPKRLTSSIKETVEGLIKDTYEMSHYQGNLLTDTNTQAKKKDSRGRRWIQWYLYWRPRCFSIRILINIDTRGLLQFGGKWWASSRRIKRNTKGLETTRLLQ